MKRLIKSLLIGGVSVFLLGILWLRLAKEPGPIPRKTDTLAESVPKNSMPTSFKHSVQEGSSMLTNPNVVAIKQDIAEFAGGQPSADAVRHLHSTIQTLAAFEVEKRKNTGVHAAKFLGGLQRALFARDLAYSATFAGWGDCTNGKAIFERSVGPRLESASLEDLEAMRGWR